jgi:hypothetical protein
LFKWNYLNKSISYINQQNFSNKYKPSICHRTIIWLGEEIHQVNCEPNILLVDHGDFISEGFELIPGLFSKTPELLYFDKKIILFKPFQLNLV